MMFKLVQSETVLLGEGSTSVAYSPKIQKLKDTSHSCAQKTTHLKHLTHLRRCLLLLVERTCPLPNWS